MSGVVISSELQTPNTGHATCSNSFTATSVAHTTLMEQTISRPSLSVDPSISSDVTQMTDAARTSNHEQSSVDTSPNLPDADMVTDKDARDDTVETIRTTEVSMSDAIGADSGPASAPHFFKDAALGVLWSLSVVSGDEW